MSATHQNTLSFTAHQIQTMLPHKYPFLLLDIAYEIQPGRSGKGHKNYSINEWFFPGHFPGNPIVPGVLLIESLAQLTAVIYLSEYLGEAVSSSTELTSLAGRVGYLVKANVKFMIPVLPGDRLDLSARVIRKLGTLSLVAVQATRGGTIAVEGELSVSENTTSPTSSDL